MKQSIVLMLILINKPVEDFLCLKYKCNKQSWSLLMLPLVCWDESVGSSPRVNCFCYPWPLKLVSTQHMLRIPGSCSVHSDFLCCSWSLSFEDYSGLGRFWLKVSPVRKIWIEQVACSIINRSSAKAQQCTFVQVHGVSGKDSTLFI